MAIVEATRGLEPPAEGIGWDGKRLDEMLAESERLFAETGHYHGIADLQMMESDPIGYEKLFARLRGGLVSARETALNISASPIVRELGELCFALYTPEGDSIALSTGIIVHVHTMSDAIKFMVRNGWEDNPKIRPGRHLRQRRPGDRRRPQRRRADLRADLLGGRADRLGGRGDPRARHRRLDSRRRPGRADQPPRRRHRPALHEDRRGRRARRLAPAALPEADEGADVLPARRAHPARRLPHDPRGRRAGGPRGGARPLQAVQPRGDRGGTALVQGADPRDDRARPLPRLRLHGHDLRRQAAAPGAGAPRLRHARSLRGADRRRRRLRARHGRRLGLGLALDELHAVGDAGGDLGDVHADPDLQRQGQRRRLLRGRDQLPRGHDRQPRRRRGLDRDRLGVPAARLHRLSADALAGAAVARLHRGGDRRLLGLAAT